MLIKRLLVALSFLILASSAQAQTLHFIITADTKDPSIGSSVAVDVANLKTMAGQIADATGMTLKLQLLTGSKFTESSFESMLSNLKPGSNDTVFYYNSSHGYRTSRKSSQWPYIYVPDSSKDWDLGAIHDTLAKKGARLTIVMGDQCNSYSDRAMPKDMPRIGKNPLEKGNYKALFLRTKGSIIVTASSPGEYSWGAAQGGEYTIAWREALADAVTEDHASWKKLLNNATRVIHAGTPEKQTPLYKTYSLVEGITSTTTSEVPPLASYTLDGGTFKRLSKDDWVLNWNAKQYNMSTYRPSTARYSYLYDKSNDDWYCVDVVDDKLWYWRKTSKEWEIWREIKRAEKPNLLSYTLDGGTFVQNSANQWTLDWSGKRYVMAPYREGTARYTYLYVKDADDWYYVDKTESKLYYWDKDQDDWRMWRTLKKKVADAGSSSYPALACATEEEMQLHKLIMEYRAKNGLAAIPLSKSLTHVARTHVRDLASSKPAGTCNMHSWSTGSQAWSGCCYTPDHAQSRCMWKKPGELTSFKGNGYEIAYGTSGYSATPAGALAGWKSSSGHNNVILNKDKWGSHPWQSVGVGMYGGYAVVWFAEESDTDGKASVCSE
ncbi:MAG TPA: caspase family protein [Leptospiraceae bacterium]|nr:caspase family protein [Leptospiraceae bacterium]